MGVGLATSEVHEGLGTDALELGKLCVWFEWLGRSIVSSLCEPTKVIDSSHGNHSGSEQSPNELWIGELDLPQWLRDVGSLK